MHQMLCGIKTPFSIRDLFQFFPHLLIYFCQIADRRPIESQCLANRDILFSYFYAIAGYCLHLFSSNKPFLLSGFFLFPFVLRCKQADGYGPVSPPLPGSEIYILLQDPVTFLYILYRFHFLKPFFCILYTRQDDTAKNSYIPYHMKVCFYLYQIYLFHINIISYVSVCVNICSVFCKKICASNSSLEVTRMRRAVIQEIQKRFSLWKSYRFSQLH